MCQAGAAIPWYRRQLEQPSSKADLLGRMLRDYEVTEEIAVREIARFLAYLESKHLARRVQWQPRHCGATRVLIK